MDKKKEAEVLMRWTSMQPGLFAPQLSMLLLQKSHPSWSGSRLRKSRYCCLTKNLVKSIGFDPSTESLSLIVTLAFAGEPSVALKGLLRLTVKVSAPS